MGIKDTLSFKAHYLNTKNLLYKIFNFSWDTTQESLLGYFSQFGEVIDCVVMKNSGTNRSRGFGFVTFADPSKIDAVIARYFDILDHNSLQVPLLKTHLKIPLLI